MRSNDEIVDIIISEKDKQGLSLSELAKRVGMAKSALSRYFNRTREFPLNKAEQFADALGITSEYLLGFDEAEKFDDSDLVAAHSNIKLEDMTDEQLEEIKQFVEFVRKRDNL